MSRSPRRDMAVVGLFAAVLVLLGGVDADAADAPELPAAVAVHQPSSTTTSSTSTTTSTSSTSTTTTAPPRNAVDDAIHRWFADVEAKARDVAWCESRHDPRAVSPGGGNHGLFQINTVHRDQFRRVTGVAFYDGVYDPYLNAQYARYLYDRQGWRPWACA